MLRNSLLENKSNVVFAALNSVSSSLLAVYVISNFSKIAVDSNVVKEGLKESLKEGLKMSLKDNLTKEVTTHV